MARITHFEIPADDPQATMQFYSNVFGWQFQQWSDEGYWMTQSGSGEGIEGAIMTRRHPGQPVVNTLSVDDLEATMAQVKANGGEIVAEKMAVPTMGWLAYFKDPSGNIHGLFQADGSAQ